jgi:L-lactate dehydrogenase complex protein LldG
MTGSDARSEILAAVRAARPAPIGAPDVRAAARGFALPASDLAARFAHAAGIAGARVIDAPRGEVRAIVASLAGDGARILSTLGESDAGVATPDDPRTLRDLELFVCGSELGVAENGAVWIASSRTADRAALFLAAQVVVVLDAASIVGNLHEAYARLDVAAHSFGAFVAGPSKTADIEQSLVIGAHGPKQLTLILAGRPVTRPDPRALPEEPIA